MISIEISGIKIDFNDKNILSSIVESKITHPYSCGIGICGACKCKLIHGEVSYLREPFYPLFDREILPCISYPLENIKLEF
jgi:ferredoxin